MSTYIEAGGIKVPSLGLGTWQSPPDVVKNAVRAALDAGYRHIDTAFNYKNEEAIGEVLQEYIASGKVKREELFIVTKLPMIHMRPDLVKRSLELSLKNLKLDYVDLYLIHAPIPFDFVDDNNLFPKDESGKFKTIDINITDTWQKMEELVDEGKARSLGVSNFNSEQIDKICQTARIQPITNQVECNAFFNQNKLQNFCKQRNMVLTAYAPLGSPNRPEHIKKPEHPAVLEDPVIFEIAKKYNKTPAQVALRNLIQKQIIAIPKSVTPERIVQNSQIFDFELTKEDMDAIEKLHDDGNRMFLFHFACDHKDYPFNIPF